MKRELTIAVAVAAILAAGISGCSSNKSTSSGSGSSGSTSATASGGGGPLVSIDGKNQNVTGSVVCTTAGGNVNIAIGGAATGIAAVLSDANP
ncbi:MAG TPA: lipoprotein LpqH, partial [Mycobacterium sp.]